MPDSHDIKPLWLVHPRLDASAYRDRLMGSVVAYPHLPTERHVPYTSAKLPRDIIPDLDPKPVRMRDMAFWQARIKDARASASFSDILQFFAQRARASKAAHVATVARMWHMDSPAQKFKALLDDAPYHDELMAMLRGSPDRAGYFITDIVTVANLETKEVNEDGTGAGGGVKVPVDVAAAVRVCAEGSWRVAREEGAEVAYDEEMIVLLGYRLVRLEKLKGMRAKLRAMLLGRKYAFSLHDGAEYWPKIKDGPVPGQVEPFLGAEAEVVRNGTDLAEERRPAPVWNGGPASWELMGEAIVRELTFDIEVVG